MGMQMQRDAFVTSMAKFTNLHCEGDMQPTNVDAYKAMHKTTTVGFRIDELEHKLQHCIVEKNGLELDTEKAIQESEHEDIKSEFITRASTLSKELHTREVQLKQWNATDYNLTLVSESVKTKNAYNTHLSEKQAMEKQLQQVNAWVETLKARFAHHKDQMKGCFSASYKLIQENRHLVLSLETTKWDLAVAPKEFWWLTSTVSSSERVYEAISRRTNDIKLELDEIKGELEDNRRKLINLKMQKDALCDGHVTSPAVANGSLSP